VAAVVEQDFLQLQAQQAAQVAVELEKEQHHLQQQALLILAVVVVEDVRQQQTVVKLAALAL
jgi:siroheme synthase